MSPRPRTDRASLETKGRAWQWLTAGLATLLSLLALAPTARAESPDRGPGFGPGFGVTGPLSPLPPAHGNHWVPSGASGGDIDPRLRLLAGPPAGAGATIAQPPEPETTGSDPSVDDPEDADDLIEQPRGRQNRQRARDLYRLETPTLLGRRTVPPFWFKRDYDTHTTTGVTFPPLYIHRKPKPGHPERLAHWDLSFTIGYYNRVREKRRWMNPLVLFFGGFSEHKSVWAAVPLLMGYRRVGEQFNFGQFPFVWWWGSKYVKNLFVAPFHYHKKAPDQLFGVSGLLVWYGNRNLDDDDRDNDRRHAVVAPIYWRFQRGLKTYDISPLYIGGKNEARGLKHRTLLPFFHWQSREFGNRRELWTLPWIQRSDKARGTKAWAVPPLLTFRDRRRDRDLMAITPLVWRHENRVLERKTWAALIGGAVVDPEQHISWVAPLWWRFADRKNQTAVSVLAPVAAWKRGPERFWLHTPLLSLWRRDTPAGRIRGGGALPVLSYVDVSPLRSRQFIAGGLFWRFVNRDPNDTGAIDAEATRRAWGVGPLVYRTRRGSERARFGVPPLLVFASREGSKRHQVVTPLLWHFRDDDPERRHDTWVVPPLYFQKRAKGFRAGLPPLFLAANDERHRYAVLPWLLFGHVEDKAESSSRTIFPLFVRTKTPERRVLGIGLIAWDVKREGEALGGRVAGPGIGQPAGERGRDSVFFPLYYRRQRGPNTLHITPVGGALRRGDGLTWLAGPVYGFARRPGEASQGRRGGGFLPLVHHETRRDASGQPIGATTVVFPLVLRDRRPERDLDIWTPLVWRGRVRGDKPRTSLSVVPFYFGQRQKEGVDVDASLLFFWSRNRTRRTHTVVVGPYYHRLSRDKLISGLGPLAYWEDSSKRRLLVVPPLIVNVEDKEARTRTTVAIPLWFDRVQRSGRRVWMAFPFVVGVHRKYDFTKAGILPPLFFDIHRLRKNYRFTGVVPFLFRYQKGGFRLEDEPSDRYTLWGSFPLFFHGRDGKGRRTHAALALYLYDRNPEGWKFFTLLGGVAQKPGKELAWYAPLIYRKVTNERHTTFVWPIFAYHRGYRRGADGKPYKDISTTWVLPPVYIGRHNEDRRWWQSTLLVWQFRRPHKVSTAVVPPIFFLQEVYKQRRLHWFLPLYVRDNNMGKGETWTSVIPGLYVQHRNQRHNNAVQFPLVWHFENDKRRATVGGFLWYDVRYKQRGIGTQVLPLIYARRSTQERVGHMIGPGLATWRRELPGQAPQLHWRALFWIIGGGNEGGERYMWLLGAKIKLKPKPLKPRRVRKRRKQKGEAEGEPESRRRRSDTREQAARNEAIEAAYGRAQSL